MKYSDSVRQMRADEVEVGDIIVDYPASPLRSRSRSTVTHIEQPEQGATISPFNLITFRTDKVTLRFRSDAVLLIDTSAHQEQTKPQNIDEIEN